MNVMWQILQGIAAVGEIFAGYYAVEVFVKRGILHEHKRYFFVWIMIIASLLAYNRHWDLGLLSWYMLIFQNCLMVFSVTKKLKINKLFGASVIMAYNVYNALLQLLFNFAMLTWIPSVDTQTVYGNMGVYRVSCYYLSVLIGITVLYILQRHISSENQLESFNKSFLLYGTAGVFLIIALQSRLLGQGKNRSSEYVFFLQIMLLASVFVLLGSIKSIETKSKLELLDANNKMLESNYYELKKVYQDYAFTFHDMKNYLIVLENYCRTGELENAIKYIEKIREPISQNHSFVNSGNEAFDLVTNFKLLEAEKRGIKTEAVIDSLPPIKLEDYEISIILGNLIDNAIEACELIKEQESWIRLQVRLAEKMLLIHLSNSCEREKTEKKSSYTNKSGLHGYGLKSVQRTAEKYDGMLKWEKKGDVFTVQVTIFDVLK